MAAAPDFTCMSPVTGTTFDGSWATMGCCSAAGNFGAGTSPAYDGIPYFYEMSGCCPNNGNPAAYNYAVQGCCGSDTFDSGSYSDSELSDAVLFTYNAEFCCENPDGTPVVGSFVTHGCCGGAEDGSGGTLFSWSLEVCCDGTIYSYDDLEAAGTVCCEDKIVDDDLCCNGELIDIKSIACCEVPVDETDEVQVPFPMTKRKLSEGIPRDLRIKSTKAKKIPTAVEVCDAYIDSLSAKSPKAGTKIF